MIRLYGQTDTFYPFFVEPNDAITSVNLFIIRDDGYFYDFNDSTFKDSAWTTKSISLLEKTEGVWIYASGWAVPDANRIYQILYKDNDNNIYTGEQVLVTNKMDNLDAAISSRASQTSVDIVKTDTAAILLDTGTDGVVVAAASKTGYAIGAGGIGSGAIAANALTSAEIAATFSEEIADAVLNRNVAGGSNTGRLVKEALYLLRNKAAIAAGTLTVYQVDDVTPQWTATVVTTAGNPISSLDPV